MSDHRERLSAPLSWWVATLGFAVTWGWIMLVVIGPAAAVIAAVLAFAAVAAVVLRYGALLVSVDGTGLAAGSARLDTAFLGDVASLDAAEYRHRLGPGADVRAHLATRPYLDRGVIVHLDDPRDPTPYWLISSRRPDALAAALQAHRT